MLRPVMVPRSAFAACVMTLAAQTAGAQDVQYRSVTKLDMGTALNIAMRMAGASEVSQTTYIKGKKMRTDAEKSSTIYDLERNRFIIINHTDKTYINAPITEMMAAFSEMTNSANMKAEAGQMKTTARDSAGNKADFTFRVKTEPTSERQNVNGQDAQRIFATLETDVSVTPQGETKAQDAGTLAVLIDTWNANSGPAYSAMQGFQQAMSKQMREQLAGSSRSFSAAFAQNPQLGEAMKKAAAEQQKMDGVAMRTTMHFVVVPPSTKFDRDAAVNPQDGGASGAAKKAIGGMLGRFGKPKEEEKPAAATAKQSTLMKVTTEIQDVQTTSLSSSLFEPPAGYRELPFNAPPRK